MKAPSLSFLIITGSSVLCLLTSLPTTGQIVPDASLPNNSIVVQQGKITLITGGTKEGGNLFHSFQQFSLSTSNTAYFNNANNTQNIITRITGASVSNIDGLIKANGGASLFLINPNGIVFGSNASLNIGGSFFATTANSLSFADGTQYNATNTKASPLLTIEIPMSLNFGSNSGKIQVQGIGNHLSQNYSLTAPFFIGAGSSFTGLKVKPGQTLALVGEYLNLDGGILTAPGGHIELGSVGSGVVNLSSTSSGWTFSYQDSPNYRNIDLLQKALVDTSSPGIGSIHLQGNNISLTGGSVILVQNQGIQPSGSIKLDALESLKLDGTAPNGIIPTAIRTEAKNLGSAGNIYVSTKNLTITNGAGIDSETYSSASGGRLIINSLESLNVAGFSQINPVFTSNILSLAYSSGKAGDINVSTNQLAIQNGGDIASSTFNIGDAGQVKITANSIKLMGVAPLTLTPSAIDSSAFNLGNAGSITIDTSNLVLQNGGRVASSTIAYGSANSVSINASTIKINGTAPGSVNTSTISSSASITDPTTRLIFNAPPIPVGGSGSVTINTRALSIANRGSVNVRNDGPSNAGTISINAYSTFLNNQGSITATSASGQGGNLFLNTRNLQLRRGSIITTTAGASGNGGNITIGTGTLVALEKSKIAANAIRGRGGNIRINSQGIFRSLDSTITASSNLGINGTVQVNTLVNPSSFGVVKLPVALVDTTKLVGQGCRAGTKPNTSKFVMVGRGGIPIAPSNTLSIDAVWSDLGQNSSPTSTRSDIDAAIPSTKYSSGPLVEASGWATNSKGEVVLVAHAPTLSPNIPWLSPTTCNAPQL